MIWLYFYCVFAFIFIYTVCDAKKFFITFKLFWVYAKSNLLYFGNILFYKMSLKIISILTIILIISVNTLGNKSFLFFAENYRVVDN
jgi:hypothetical protein